MILILRNLHSHVVPSSLHKFSTSYGHFAKTRYWKYSMQNASVPKIQGMNRKIPVINKQNYDYFLVLDFEATCEEGVRIMPHQETVVNQETLPDVLNAFDKWLFDSNLINADHSMKSLFTFVTCGDWDLGVLLPSEANYRNLELPKQVFNNFYFKRWINLKKAFCRWKGYFAKSLTVMLRDLELNHVGRLHSGIDDVKNMCQITRCLAESGYVFQNTSIYLDAEHNFKNL
uniref:Exonuclease domain-containing protein n=1 Tax=Elaeophora elaphi TaxID=1147741 RepID=A0A0R3S191_9BILA